MIEFGTINNSERALQLRKDVGLLSLALINSRWPDTIKTILFRRHMPTWGHIIPQDLPKMHVQNYINEYRVNHLECKDYDDTTIFKQFYQELNGLVSSDREKARCLEVKREDFRCWMRRAEIKPRSKREAIIAYREQHPTLTSQQVNRIKELLLQGTNTLQISKKLKIARDIIRYYANRYGYRLPDRKEAQAQKYSLLNDWQRRQIVTLRTIGWGRRRIFNYFKRRISEATIRKVLKQIDIYFSS